MRLDGKSIPQTDFADRGLNPSGILFAHEQTKQKDDWLGGSDCAPTHQWRGLDE